jgi:MOSC domain-containing protein YiiM
MTADATMRLACVSVGRPHVIMRGGRQYSSAINRRPVEGPIELTTAGLVGDRVSDLKYHGSPDQAVCCYPLEHYDYWRTKLGAAMPVPSFGENFTTEGLLETAVCVGDVYRIGGAVVQVSRPREPCFKLANKHGQPSLPRWIRETGYTGFYCRVLEPGVIQSGDAITLLDRPHPTQTIAAAMAAGEHTNQ